EFRPGRHAFEGDFLSKMELKPVETSLDRPAQGGLVGFYHHGNALAPLRQQPLHRIITRPRHEAWGLRVQDESKKVRANAVGEVRVDQARQPADLESDPIDHRAPRCRDRGATQAWRVA